MLAKLTCRGRDLRAWPSRRPGGRWRSSGSAASPPTSRSCRPCSTTPTSPAGRVTTSFIETHPQLLQARGQADRGTKLLDYLADVTVNQPHGAGAGDASTRRTKLPDGRPRRAGARRHPPAAARGRARRSSPAGCAPRSRSRSPTRRSATPTSRCSRPGCAPATCSPWPATSPGRRPSCGRSSAGAGRRTTSRCASSPRTRGSGWPRCARRCPTSACRCCCAAATRSATRRTRPR